MLGLALSDQARLRLLQERDAPELYALIEANRRYLSRWMPWAQDETLEETLNFIRLTRRQLAENGGMQTAIAVDGAIAGTVGRHPVSWQDGSTSIGYWLAEPFQGRGIMTAAVRAHIDDAFGSWGLHPDRDRGGDR